ncbi:hypothetical protein HHK36_004834 [Tetracentron sinense]|uniref:Small RNA 2'-O-methyltransferase n=1 Tax=Tetracentron sinense TaxID=13715 RepID=A0A834ZNA1_TETSI|nr:hypothetical protein HHK36_004834 [Tetracentron sinense]
MESGESADVAVKKTNLTPKAIIHQKFGSNACYTIEEVQESVHNECPGLAIPQQGPCLFRCSLQLPEFSVTSGTFKKKKDAEQSAAKLALEKVQLHFLSFEYFSFLYQLLHLPPILCHISLPPVNDEVNDHAKGRNLDLLQWHKAKLEVQKLEERLIGRLRYAIYSFNYLLFVFLFLLQLGVQPTMNNPTGKEAWDDLISRVSYLFSNECGSTLGRISKLLFDTPSEYFLLNLFGSSVKFVSALHPLSGHFRAALRREGDLHGLLPVSILAVCDTKLNNLCKSINNKVESDPSCNISLIIKAAKLSGSVATSEGKLWTWRQNPYSPEVQALINQQSSSVEVIRFEAIQIPCSIEKPVEPVTLDVSSNGYYMDVIAQKLGVPDASGVLVSRTIGKSSSEMRLYFSAPELHPLDSSSSDLLNTKQSVNLKNLNARACYFSGQNVYGDAILAAVGYTWKSTDLFHEDVSLRTYYRMLIGKLPDGSYKLSREAILAAELPVVFTTRSNWRGSLPRELLCIFCRQHRLSEPVFSTVSTSTPLGSSSKTSESCKKLKVTKSGKEEKENANGGGMDANGDESVGSGGTFKCKVDILSKGQDLIIECSPEDSYRKQSDAIQNTALKVLSWLNKYFKELDMPMEKLSTFGDVLGIRFCQENFFKEFALCVSVHTVQQRRAFQVCSLLESNCMDHPYIKQGHGVCSFNIEGPDSAVSPCNGSLICISYAVSLVWEGEHMKEPLESNDDFEFEIGSGAVIPQLEVCVTQMSVDQSAHFNTELPPEDLIIAAASNSAKDFSLSSSKACYLEYSITLLRVTEPLEDRMEQALFSPPLSKQRVEYALRHINESCATTLVDFGCGSGSLLDSLLNYPTALEKIVGVDISRKSLSRAAKVLHSKLSINSDTVTPSTSIKSALLYDGSITDFDSRLYGFDIGTCLEVPLTFFKPLRIENPLGASPVATSVVIEGEEVVHPVIDSCPVTSSISETRIKSQLGDPAKYAVVTLSHSHPACLQSLGDYDSSPENLPLVVLPIEVRGVLESFVVDLYEISRGNLEVETAGSKDLNFSSKEDRVVISPEVAGSACVGLDSAGLRINQVSPEGVHHSGGVAALRSHCDSDGPIRAAPVVIEHMEEDQACLFGDVVLSSFCPRILIVSTPNYEYNPILQKSSMANREEDADEKNQSLPCKFRNNDHKFEWTREQFNRWASHLAIKHNYSVEFSGVGGSADMEPGFASQIAVFRREALHLVDKCLRKGDLAHHYEVIWEWSSSNSQ